MYKSGIRKTKEFLSDVFSVFRKIGDKGYPLGGVGGGGGAEGWHSRGVEV